MPKVKLEFNLPEEEPEFRLIMSSQGLFSVLWNLNEYLRSKLKYELEDEKEIEIYEKIRDKLSEILYNEDINLDSL